MMKAFLAVAVALCCGGMALAAPITYTESATATGSLNGTAFTSQLVTLSMTGDTSIVSGGSGFFTIFGTVSLRVAGTGSGTITDSMQVFVNQSYLGTGAAGFGAQGGGSLLDTIDSAFIPYALITAFGPITNANFINPGLSFNTTAGAFIINSAGNSTFTATIPEPMSFGLVGLGLATLAGVRLRRRRS